MNHDLVRPEPLFHHLFRGDRGVLVTASSSGEDWAQEYWRYPEQASQAAESVIEQAQLVRNAFFGVHLYQKFGNRRAANAVGEVRCLWLDEDGGTCPKAGPEPTAIIFSSRERRHLYWRLAHPVSVEWAVDLNRRIAEWAGGDRGKAGLSSVLRPPGTGNYKRGKPDLVTGYLTGVPAWEAEVLEQAIPLMPKRESPPYRGPYTGPAIDLAPYLEAVDVLAEVPDSLGEKFLIVCPWVGEHSDGNRTGTRLGKLSTGALWFHCDHEHCQGRTWREFRKKVRPLSRRVRIRRPGYTGPDVEARIYG